MSYREDLQHVLSSPRALEKIKVSDATMHQGKAVLADLHFNNIIYVYNFLIIIKSISEVEKASIVVNVPFNAPKELRELIRCCGHKLIYPDIGFIAANIFRATYNSLLYIKKYWNFHKIIEHGIDSLLYDSLLIAKAKPSLKGVSLAMALDRLILEHIYLLFYRSINTNFRLLIVGDTSYRYGLLLDCLSAQSDIIVSPVNVNNFKMYCNFKEIGTNIPRRDEISSIVDVVQEYYTKRKSNSIVHHDVNNAFQGGKGVLSDKPLVVLSAHIFSDAPHNTALIGFRDYYDWFVKVCEFISGLNPDEFDVYVRPHPSANLYGEDGLVEELAKIYSLRTLGNEVSSQWILENATVIFTCGGTIAVEFAMEGKKAIASATTRFPAWNITFNAYTQHDFEAQFRKSLNTNVLRDDDVSKRAAMLGYYYFELFDSNFKIETSFLQLYYHKDYVHSTTDLIQAIKQISNSNAALKHYISQSINYNC